MSKLYPVGSKWYRKADSEYVPRFKKGDSIEVERVHAGKVFYSGGTSVSVHKFDEMFSKNRPLELKL